jgi:GDP-L-fucose synthase
MNKKSKIFITGHNGMVGSSLLHRLRKEGFTNLLVRTPSQLDLSDQKAVRSFLKRERPEYCFLTPMKEGGIEANIAYPAELIYENLAIQINIINAAYETKVKKLLFFASSCVYPKHCPQPMREEYLLKGPLESTNEPYAVAKIAGIKMCQAYNKQYGTNFISLIPATVYGPYDNFDLKTSHVISALIRKFHEAKVKKKSKVTVWGTGRSHREFIYVDDLVDAYIFLMQHYDSSEIINIGTGIDISISDLAKVIKEIVGFEGEIEFDTNKPDGVLRKLLDISRLSSLGWEPKIELRSGLETTCRWYLKKLNLARSPRL